MLTNRIIGAFTFRRGVYAEVEQDTTFTTTAWLIVIVISFLNQIGANATLNVFRWFGGAVVGTLFAIVGFAVAAVVINWVGRELYKADVSFDELVRTLGLAYVWNIIGVIGIVTALSDFLACLLAPISVAAAILLVIAWFMAAKEALDLEWTQTIITVIVGWIALVVVMIIGGLVLTTMGLGAAAMGSLLGV